jgi:hypothetical protein
MDDSWMAQNDLQALIAETEALGWDNHDHLVSHDCVLSPQEGFAFIGKLLALKAQNIYHVRATLSFVWSFAAPMSMEILAPNKYLFTVPQENHFNSIIKQGPFRRSLLLL